MAEVGVRVAFVEDLAVELERAPRVGAGQVVRDSTPFGLFGCGGVYGGRPRPIRTRLRPLTLTKNNYSYSAGQ